MATHSFVLSRCYSGGFIGEPVVGRTAAIRYVSHHCGFHSVFLLGAKLPKMVLGSLGTFAASAITTFISLFAGATGPLVAAFTKQLEVDRFRTVASFAMAMSLQHGVKVVVFEGMGVAIIDWWLLLICMIMSGTLGTWIGLKILKRVADKHFHTAFSIVFSLLAIRLI